MTTIQLLLALLPVAYLLGSIPFGLIIAKRRGIDLRTAGSGNIGATNVGRLLGKKVGITVFMLDLLKGLLPTLTASIIVGRHLTMMPGDQTLYFLWLAAGFAAIMGHMFSLFLRFKGGKGVATSAGVVLGVWPDYTLAALLVLAVWGVCFKVTRIVSLSSLVAAVLFPVAYALTAVMMRRELLGPRWPLLAFAIVVAAMIVWKHRTNIARLRAGTETSFRRKSEPLDPPKHSAP